MTLRDAKRAMRERIVALRDGLSVERRATASLAIAERIAALQSFRRSETVLLTLPYRSEWDARLLMDRALAAGKRVAAPRVDLPARMLGLFRIVDPLADIEPGHRGIPEPRATCAPIGVGDVDWVLVPGLAFDATGRRLGYGGGYYDRLLPLLPAMAPKVAGAFDIQIVDVVPAALHDIAMDCVVTETRTFHRAASATT